MTLWWSIFTLCTVVLLQGLECRAQVSGELPADPDTSGQLSHPRVENPEDLDDSRAEEIYSAIRPQLQKIYARSDDPVAIAYSTWKRYNRYPYRSSQHGQLFVNNYANPRASAYGRYEAGGKMPVGALIVKDSFNVTTAGDIEAGPLFLMEKMPGGFDGPNGDWRYMLISGDGTVQGLSGGYGSQNVEFCGACHRTRAPAADHLFFVPHDLRR